MGQVYWIERVGCPMYGSINYLLPIADSPDFNYIGIGETDWAFKTLFEVTEDEFASPNIDLVFEGLDTFAVIQIVSS